MLLNSNFKDMAALRRRQKGFLLLEVMLSLLIMSAGISAVIKSYTISLRAQRHAQCYTFAFLLADKIHQEIKAEVINDLKGREETSAGLFHWSIEIEPVYPEEFEAVTVKVNWEERAVGYEISLSNSYPKNFLEEQI